MKLYKFYIRECGRENQYPDSKYAFLPISKDDNRWGFNEKGIEGKFTAIPPEAFKASDYEPNTDVAVVQYINFNVVSQSSDSVVIRSANIAYFTTANEIAEAKGLDQSKCRKFYTNFIYNGGGLI